MEADGRDTVGAALWHVGGRDVEKRISFCTIFFLGLKKPWKGRVRRRSKLKNDRMGLQKRSVTFFCSVIFLREKLEMVWELLCDPFGPNIGNDSGSAV